MARLAVKCSMFSGCPYDSVTRGRQKLKENVHLCFLSLRQNLEYIFKNVSNLQIPTSYKSSQIIY